MNNLTKPSNVYRVRSLQEMQITLKNISGIVPAAGATGFLNNQTGDILDLPQDILDITKIPELREISKTERYFEFGAAVTLNEILNLGKKNVPPVLYSAIEKISNNSLRSLGTIGGNIAEANCLSGTFLPLLALDAKLEIRTADETEWVPFAKYIDTSYNEKKRLPYVITKIRLPNESWTKSFYARLGMYGYIYSDTASFLFLIRIQKNILSEMRLLFSSEKLVREKEFDNLLLGRIVPLPRRDVSVIMEKSKRIFTADKFGSDFHYACFFNLLEDNLYNLT